MTELLKRLIDLLDAAGIPFMIVGSFASSAHGLPRTTQDLDLILDPPSPEALERLLDAVSPDEFYFDAEFARDALARRSLFNLVAHASGWKVDLIFRKDRAFSREEFARRVRTTLLGIPVFLASPEDTIIAKLEWSKRAGGSERQRRDIAGILATLEPGLDHAYLDRWINDLDLTDEWIEAQRPPR